MAKQTVEITKATRLAVFEEYCGVCAGCGMADPDMLEHDHVQPRAFFVARKMPVDHSAKNVQLLCGACNRIKADIEYMPRMPARKADDSVMRCKANREIFRAMVESFRAEQRRRNNLWAD